MADVFYIKWFRDALARGFDRRHAVAHARIERPDFWHGARHHRAQPAEVYICLPCGATYKTARGYERHRCKGSEARHG